MPVFTASVTCYECTAVADGGDDKFIEWDGRNRPRRIALGTSKTDATLTARDEFGYRPDGRRYHRKTNFTDADGNETTTAPRNAHRCVLVPAAGSRTQGTQEWR